MAWKFFNVGKANAEIDRLEAELAKVNKERDDLKASAETNTSEVAKQAEQLSADLATAKATIAGLQSEIAAANTKAAQAEAAKAEITKQLEEKGKSVEAEASKKAAEITAQIGAAPAPVVPASAKTSHAEVTGIARVQASIKQQISNPTK